MKVIKKINNNVALCVDDNNKTVVAFGNGIGFQKPPYEVDLNRINRTYYDVDPQYLEMINSIPQEVLEITGKIVDYAKNNIYDIKNPNLVFVLADHINFAIKRYKEKINIKLPVLYDMQLMYPREMAIAKKALKMIRDELKIFLPKEEASCIALYLVNSQTIQNNNEDHDEKIIEEITGIVERSLNIKVNTEEFNYSRFVSHVHYLLERGKEKKLLSSANGKLYKNLATDYPEINKCALNIKDHLINYSIELSDEEIVYLMLHINRLYSREI